MGLAHDGHHGHAAGRPDRLLTQEGQQLGPVVEGDRGEDVRDARHSRQLVLAGRLGFESGEVQ